MKIPEDWNLNNYKHSKAIQVLMYAYLYQQNHSNDHQFVTAGNISFKKLSSGFLPITFSGSRDTKNQITQERLLEFQESLGEIFKEIFDINTPFIEKEN